MLGRRLTRSGYECVTAEATDAAARQLQQHEFYFVALDTMIPGRSGIDFLTEIMAKQPDVAVLMLTGVADEATAVKAMQEGAYDYVIKPLELPDLLVRIEHAQSLRSLRLENRKC